MTHTNQHTTIAGIVLLAIAIFGGVYWFHSQYYCVHYRTVMQTTCTTTSRLTTCRTFPVESCDDWAAR